MAKRLSLPLPNGFFVCPPLDPIASNVLVEQARRGVEELVTRGQLDRSEWRIDTDDGNKLQTYASVNRMAMLGVTTIHASLDEVAVHMRFDTHAKYLAYNSHMHADLLDCASLYNLATSRTEYVGIKWDAVPSPVPGIVKPRDAVGVECFRPFTQHGISGIARSFQSVEIACCPDLSETLGLSRMETSLSGYIFRETLRRGELQVMYLLTADSTGMVPAWLVKIAVRNRVKCITAFETFFRQRRVGRMNLRPGRNDLSMTNPDICTLCCTKLPRLQERVSCSVCGEVTCSRCQKVHLEKGRKIRVCNLCSALPTNRTSTSKSGTTSSMTMEDDALDNYEPVRSLPRRDSAPVPAMSPAALRPVSSSEPPLIHLYTPPPEPRKPVTDRVQQLFDQLKALDFDDAVLSKVEAKHIDQS
ncbi:unnamed protein product [Aphanomyces euteiches]|uniref:START domain-containing protein n=1 Tax=Aphanomyces euteiches TaxID=100861 RepID=A0A6G0WAJ7_9STRA|nr:hypothetical protein Ae201684_017558 [Aphanomyces euteiches]KAH9068901.1 hypothetical protein Ae201684P_004599 [Aphanomyces euteiches]KAH9155367.1 hypothetical protein AeRB84_002662 [Aphanomyces euteiches]